MLQPSSISEARLFLLFSAPPRRFSAVGWAGWIPLHLRLDAAALNPSATCLIIRPLQSGPHTHTYTHASTRTYTHTHTHLHMAGVFLGDHLAEKRDRDGTLGLVTERRKRRMLGVRGDGRGVFLYLILLLRDLEFCCVLVGDF